jgi:hypothetical protein
MTEEKQTATQDKVPPLPPTATDADIVAWLRAKGFQGPIGRAYTRSVPSRGPNGSVVVTVGSKSLIGFC